MHIISRVNFTKTSFVYLYNVGVTVSYLLVILEKKFKTLAPIFRMKIPSSVILLCCFRPPLNTNLLCMVQLTGRQKIRDLFFYPMKTPFFSSDVRSIDPTGLNYSNLDGSNPGSSRKPFPDPQSILFQDHIGIELLVDVEFSPLRIDGFRAPILSVSPAGYDYSKDQQSYFWAGGFDGVCTGFSSGYYG